jgi:hypothetical protein
MYSTIRFAAESNCYHSYHIWQIYQSSSIILNVEKLLSCIEMTILIVKLGKHNIFFMNVYIFNHAMARKAFLMQNTYLYIFCVGL